MRSFANTMLALLISSSLSVVANAQTGSPAKAAPPVQQTVPADSTAPQSPSARPPLMPAMAFAERSGISEMSLSPDGKKIAFRMVQESGKVHFAVVDAVSRKTEHSLVVPEKDELEWFRWAGNGKLILSISRLGEVEGEEYRYTRLYLYDLQSKALSFVGKKEMGFVGDDVLYVDPAGAFVLLAMQRTLFDWPSIWRFPLDGTALKNGKQVQAQRAHVWDWYADDKGVVRLGFEQLSSGDLRVLYRKTEGENFKQIAKIDPSEKQSGVWQMLRIVTESDDGYVLQEDESGRVALRKFNYATGEAGETVFAQPGWDIDEVLLDNDNKPVAAFYTDDRDRVVWFNPAMKALQAKFDKALKGADVWISSRADDDSRMLVWAASENDPGSWYIYTAETKRMELFYFEKSKLDLAHLPKPKPIAFTARDGTPIKGYLTLPLGRDPKKLPLIVLPHGGPFGVRDKLRFDSEVQYLANRGYAVLQANYRGSKGYGEEFSKLGDGQIGRKMQDDLDDAVDWASAQGLVDPARVCVVGSSYGGYAALWAVIRNPERYRCAASFAGVTDWNAQLRYDRNFFSRAGGKKWKQRVIGDQTGFSLDQVSPAKQASRLNRPVLLAHGEEDTNVPFKQFKAMRDAAAKEGKTLEMLTFPEEGHGLDKAENEARWLDTLGAFLAKHNPAD